MAEPKILADNERGQTRVEGNAFIQDSKIEDAAELRVGAPKGPSSGGGGKVSIDITTRDDNGIVISRRAIAEITAGEGIFGAEFTISVLKKDGQSTDADMLKAIRITGQDGIEFLLPTKGGATTGSGGPPNELREPGGIFWLVIQDDGNFVAYKNRMPYDYGSGVAYWSSGTANPVID